MAMMDWILRDRKWVVARRSRKMVLVIDPGDIDTTTMASAPILGFYELSERYRCLSIDRIATYQFYFGN